MELSQMVTQGMWDRDSMLLQLPHFTKELTERWQENGIESIFDLAELSADKMQNLLQLPNSQLKDITDSSNGSRISECRMKSVKVMILEPVAL